MKIILTVENFNKIMKSCVHTTNQSGTRPIDNNIQLHSDDYGCVCAVSLNDYSCTRVYVKAEEGSDKGIAYIPCCKPIKDKLEWENQDVSVVIGYSDNGDYAVTLNTDISEVICAGNTSAHEGYLDTSRLFERFKNDSDAKTLCFDPKKLDEIIKTFSKTGERKPSAYLTFSPAAHFIKLENNEGDVTSVLLGQREENKTGINWRRNEDWDAKLEDMIYHLYRRYDIRNQKETQVKLKEKCLNELNNHPDLKSELQTDKQIEFFIMQMAFENIS